MKMLGWKIKRAITQGLVEGEDFYIDKGLMILTEKYLLKKGKCCHHGCRHCPWKKHKKVDNNKILSYID